MTTRIPLTSRQVVDALATKHRKDVFVPECKTGSTWTGSPVRLDAWAMKRSWTQWTTWGYEVKVDRSDFLRDEKWPEYLDYCHQFSFVCPWGLIKETEVPEGCGLLWATSGGQRLITKVKAPRREIDVPVSVLIYILMSRSIIESNLWDGQGSNGSREHNLRYWRRWLAQKDESRDLGHKVSTAIRVRVNHAENELHKAEALMRRVAETEQLLMSTLGISLYDLHEWKREERLKDAISGIPGSLLRSIEATREQLDNVHSYLQTLRSQAMREVPS